MTGDLFPIIDVSPLIEGAPGGAATVGRAIREASERIGFYLIVNHGVPAHLRARIFEENARFHALPVERKLEIKLNPHFRGYQPFAGSTLKISTVETAAIGNQSESFFIRHEVDPATPGYGNSVLGPNQWPRDLPGFRETVLAYDDALRALGNALLPALAFAMGQDEDAFRDLFTPPSTILRLLHYPPHAAPRDSGVFGIAPHTDYGFMTILAQDAVGGLEVRPRGGDWTPVPVLPDAFVVNAGDAVPRLTNGRFASTPHRVINTSAEHSRYSVPYFFDPRLDATLETLEGFGAAAPEQAPVRFGDYLLERLETNYPDRVYP